jgi:hypothetical protein
MFTSVHHHAHDRGQRDARDRGRRGHKPLAFILRLRPQSRNTSRTDGKRAGGSGFIAYPAEYRSSGVMTFVVSERDDVVYEKDLGPNTSALAAGMEVFHKDATWRAADE